MKAQLRRRGAVVGACAVVAVGLTACGSSSKSSSSSGGGATTSSATSSAASGGSASLGPPKPAKGKPVVFGMINIESNSGADFPEVRQAAQAAVKYVNTYGGGLDGHPIQLNVCITDGSPATSVQCANKLIAQHPVAILGGTDLAQAIRRTLVPADYAGVLAFVVSDRAGVITGQTISADAGLVLR